MQKANIYCPVPQQARGVFVPGAESSAKERLFHFRRTSTLPRSNISESQEDLIAMGDFTESDIKAGAVIAQLKEDFDLGRGHVMAIVKLLREGVLTKA